MKLPPSKGSQPDCYPAIIARLSIKLLLLAALVIAGPVPYAVAQSQISEGVTNGPSNSSLNFILSSAASVDPATVPAPIPCPDGSGDYLYATTWYSNFVYMVGSAGTSLPGELIYREDPNDPNGMNCGYSVTVPLVLPGPTYTISFTPFQVVQPDGPNIEEDIIVLNQDAPPPVTAIGTVTLNPKYIVLGVVYNPPGAKSTASYTSTSSVGTSTSLTDSFKAGVSVSVSQGATVSIAGSGAGATGTATTTFSQQTDSTSSKAVTDTDAATKVIDGPASSTVGVDHDFDKIYVWINPLIDVTVYSDSSLNWTAYSYNNLDNQGMDVVEMPVSWLENPTTIPADVASRLARTWDTSGLGGLTDADYATILQRDPVVNAAYNPSTDSLHRYDYQGINFNYEPAAQGEQPAPASYTVTHQVTTTSGR